MAEGAEQEDKTEEPTQRRLDRAIESGDVANSVYVPDYWRYDAMASYKLTRNVDFQLNVQNVFDKKYFDKAYAAHYASEAAGRTVLLTTNFHF